MAELATCLYCVIVILKPQEFIGALSNIPIVHGAFALAAVSTFVLFFRRGRWPRIAPHVPLVGAFFAWATLTTALKRPDALATEATSLGIVFATAALLCVAPSWTKPRRLAMSLLGCAIVVSIVAMLQSSSPYGCMLGSPADWEGKGELEFDGRPCDFVDDCRVDAPNPNANYRCERVGPWKTASIGGRVRYRGSLADPNELALMISMALPFAFALSDIARARSRAGEPGKQAPFRFTARSKTMAFVRSMGLWLCTGLVGFVIILTRSRGGVLAFLVVLGIELARRFRAWALVGAAGLLPGMLLLGGRSGEEADASSNERMELLREVFEMIRTTHGFGVGAGQFADESSLGLTAHNAYALALAETGLVGAALFAIVMYVALKTVYVIWRRSRGLPFTLTRLAAATFAGLVSGAIGIVFLSWAYKDVLYMMIGMSGALWAAAREANRRFAVRLPLAELGLAVCAVFALLVGQFAYVKTQGVP